MYAVKTIRRDVLQMASSPTKRHSITTEIEILKTLDHPNVIKLYEVYDDERAIYLVMELCTGGELYEYVNSAQYTERQVRVSGARVAFALPVPLYSGPCDFHGGHYVCCDCSTHNGRHATSSTRS